MDDDGDGDGSGRSFPTRDGAGDPSLVCTHIGRWCGVESSLAWRCRNGDGTGIEVDYGGHGTEASRSSCISSSLVADMKVTSTAKYGGSGGHNRRHQFGW